MKRLIEDLALIDWEDPTWCKSAADILRGTPALSDIIAEYISGLPADDRVARFDSSHETSTHYKWLLHRDATHRFALWLHDYKPAHLKGPGYAEVPHNHRYDLCSIILNGGYESVTYDVTGEVRVIKAEIFGPGDVLSMRHDEVHSLRSVHEATRTLFIEGPTIKHFSSTFPLDRMPRDFMDFPGRWPALYQGLKNSVR